MRTSATALLLCALIGVFLIERAAGSNFHGLLRTRTLEACSSTLTTRQNSRTYEAPHGEPDRPQAAATIATIATEPTITTVPVSEEQTAEDEEIEEWLSLFVQGAVIEESNKTTDDVRNVRAALGKLEQRLDRLEKQNILRTTTTKSAPRSDIAGLKKLAVNFGLLGAALLFIRHGIIPSSRFAFENLRCDAATVANSVPCQLKRLAKPIDSVLHEAAVNELNPFRYQRSYSSLLSPQKSVPSTLSSQAQSLQ